MQKNHALPFHVIASAALALFSNFGAKEAFAFSVEVHREITKEKLGTVEESVAGQKKKFSERALDQIAEANEAVDYILTGSAALFSPERHFTNDKYSASSKRIKDLKDQIVAELKSNPPDGSDARKKFGQALHTIQDFYAHSNWVERGHASINASLGKDQIADPSSASAACPNDPNKLGTNGGGSDTSGFFVGKTISRDTFGCVTAELPSGKCFHGNYRPACIGINKDLDADGATAEGVSKSEFHDSARSLAEAATLDFVEQILSQLRGNDRAVSAFLDLRGTMGFVVDDTGSMGPSIDGVKSQIQQIIDSVTHGTEQPDNYLFLRFGDPDVGNATVTTDPNVLLAAVNGLVASGGGDCPERSQTALKIAIGATLPNSQLYLFTDASAKDSGSANSVISAAQAKGTKLSYSVTGSCSPIDPAYIRGATETGGRLFVLSPSELTKLFDLVEPQLDGTLVRVASRSGSLSPDVQSVTFPVDTTIGTLVAAASYDSSGAGTLYRPGGIAVTDSDPDVKITSLDHGQIFTVRNPQGGFWRIDLTGGGAFRFTVDGNSRLDFGEFHFVEANADIHGGYFPIPGQPLAKAEAIGQAKIFGPFDNVAFSLVDEAGLPIGDLTLTRNHARAQRDAFIGPIALPSTPFRIIAAGQDATGAPFRREYAPLYRAQTVRVEVGGDSSVSAAPGKHTTVPFVVTNIGQGGTFSLEISSSAGFPITIDSSVLSLAEGESKTVTAGIDIPASATIGDVSALALTATATANSNIFNSATVDIAVQVPVVVFEFSGFVPPVANPPSINKAKAGSTVPIKFSLKGNQGLDIVLAGGPRSQQLSCDTQILGGATERTIPADKNGLRYDPAADQYIYNWKTNSAWAGSCRQLQVRLKDDTTHVANFSFTK